MSDTALTLLQDSFEKLKIYPPGVTIGSADSARGLQCLNDMLDSWSNDTWTCFANVEQTFTLVPGVQSYTIGTSGGAQVQLTRPLEISNAPGTAYLVDSNQNRYPINVIEQDQWNSIGLLNTTSQLPDTMFYDPQFPLAIINIFPLPLTAYNIYFDSRLQLADLTALSSPFSLPPGYRSAIRDNLCLELWTYYKTGDPWAWLMKSAMDKLAVVKRTNMKQSPATYDSAVVSKGTATYNIYTDSVNRGNR